MPLNKKVLLGVTGSISAYKSASVARLLVKAGCEVKVILTKGGAQFITPLTLATVSKNPVITEFYNKQNGEWHNHVELGEWADLILVAPASANVIAHFANGLCNNVLHATYLSAKSKVLVCPAMDHDMWHHKSVQRNIATLNSDGIIVMPPEKGELASGIFGDGRLPEPENIISFIEDNI